MGPLLWNNDLHFASKEHSDDIGSSGLYGHESSLGLSIFDRIRNYTEKEPGMLAENVCFGSSSAFESVFLMLIDDGDDERKMRLNIFDPSHKLFGMSVSRHKFQNGVAVAMMCLEFLEKWEVSTMHYNINKNDKQYQFY